MREFLVGQPVLVRDYRQDHKWVTGAVRSSRGPLNYVVAVGPCVWKWHVDQMWDTGRSCEAQPFQSADPPVRMELEGSGSTEGVPAPAEAVCAETDAIPASAGAASQPTEIARGTRQYPQRHHKAPERSETLVKPCVLEMT